jgi:hypothetical protein
MTTRSYPVIPGTLGLIADIQALRPTPGTCIFIDVTGSTAMKNTRTTTQWLLLLSNCFSDSKSYLSPFPLLKTIGDELMYYIEDSDLAAAGYNHFQVYDNLWQIAVQQSGLYPDVKISAAWCDDVYPVTFIPGQQDYYGLGIDQTARLKGEAKPKEVVIDEQLHQRVMQYEHALDHESIKKLQGPRSVQPSGIASPVNLYTGC